MGDHSGLRSGTTESRRIFSTFERRWLLGAVVLPVNWPYTVIVIMLINRRLMNTPAGGATAETGSIDLRHSAARSYKLAVTTFPSQRQAVDVVGTRLRRMACRSWKKS